MRKISNDAFKIKRFRFCFEGANLESTIRQEAQQLTLFSEPFWGPWGLYIFTPGMYDLGAIQSFGLFPACFWLKILETFTRWPPGPD